MKSSAAVCRSKEELEAAFTEYVVYLHCRYQCWVGGEKTDGENQSSSWASVCHISVPALLLWLCK